MNSTISYPNVTSANFSASGHQKKRSRSGDRDGRRKFDPKKAPPLPPTQGDLILQVFTHKSLRQHGLGPEHYGDNERLASLGRVVFEMVFTCYLFKKRPMLKAGDLAMQRSLLYARGMVYDWVQHYGFMKRLVAAPDVLSKLDAREDGVTIFYAYVGALFTSSGPEATHGWIDCLLSQEDLIQPETAMMPDPSRVARTPPQKRVKSEAESPPPPDFWRRAQAPKIPSSSTSRHTPTHYTAQPLPPPSASNMLPPRATNAPNPLAPAQPQAAFLPLFNQAATKRKVTVEYLAEFSGLKHAGNWTVKCIVNGIPKGEGRSSHKQAAKEEAARNAYYSMGWQ